MMHVNMMSGGKGSWGAGKIVAARHGADNLVHLFTDPKYEDADLYRFLPQAVANIGGRLVTLCEGRSVWEVFRDTRIVGNNRVAPCSRILKQQPARAWVEENCDPAEAVLYVGILWYERKRMESYTDHAGKRHIGIRERWLPYRVEAPLIDPPHYSPAELLAWLEREGIDPPRLYDEGFPTNNCGGRCVKQGQDGWRRLLLKRRESFLEVEAHEEEMREYLGKDVSILKDRRGGKTTPLPLRVFRERIDAGQGCDLFDVGQPCSCMLDGEE